MPRRPFYRLLDAVKHHVRVCHHVSFLQSCCDRDIVPRTCVWQKKPFFDSKISPSFAEQLQSTSLDHAIDYRDLALQEAKHQCAQRSASIEDITNGIIDEVGLQEYVNIRSDVDRVVSGYARKLKRIESDSCASRQYVSLVEI